MEWIRHLEDLAQESTTAPRIPDVVRDAVQLVESFLETRPAIDERLSIVPVPLEIEALNRMKVEVGEEAAARSTERLIRTLIPQTAASPEKTTPVLAEALALYASLKTAKLNLEENTVGCQLLALAGRIALLQPSSTHYLRILQRAATVLGVFRSGLALRALRDGLDLAHSLGDHDTLRGIQTALANQHAFNRRPDLALPYFRQMLDGASPFDAEILYGNAALAALGAGDFELAEQYVDEYGAYVSHPGASPLSRWRLALCKAACEWGSGKTADESFDTAVCLARMCHPITDLLTTGSYLLYCTEIGDASAYDTVMRSYLANRETPPPVLDQAFRSHLTSDQPDFRQFEEDLRSADPRAQLIRPAWATPLQPVEVAQ